MLALLVSTYDLGHQPFGIASPAAWLRREGFAVHAADLAKQSLADDVVRDADLIAFHLPMHTATRLAVPVIRKVRSLNPDARICTYGLYAPLNSAWLRSLGVDDILGGEFEDDLAGIAREIALGRREDGQVRAMAMGTETFTHSTNRKLPRLQFLIPDRSGLPALSRYAMLNMGNGSRRVAGYTEASRGCRHLCRHCPVVPAYQGQFRVVQPEVVLADVGGQISAGAEHITFGDPDFFNGPTHAMRVVEALHAGYPSVTYDVTIKIEHLLRCRDLLPRLRETGCLFVTSAVESLDDGVLAILDKGHTRADFVRTVSLCRDAGITLTPTFVAFHPWLTRDSYCDLLDTIASLDLVDHVAPIQLAIRLLIPEGSLLLERSEVRPFLGEFDRKTLAYPWSHPDPEVDRLQREIMSIVGARPVSDRAAAFNEITALAHDCAGLPMVHPPQATDRPPVPYMDEPWYCCAEPNPEQLRMV